jgi:hypothetical protein
MGITHGNLLRTYMQECQRAFLQKLQVTLVMQAVLPCTNMYSHAGKILAYSMCWGGTRHYVCVRARSLLLLLLSLSLSLSLARSLSISLSRSLALSRSPSLILSTHK